ncbi:single-stranded DNA-binding protein [Bacillus swezeyi]|uniref:Single-stranded DNA-binding protein n=1 Tax=Bacillus swezeyi TaxID=1925020 RepID=A0A5M8S0W5_9BACI|nr:single-stranded DNA-binding protein [Bacillus swezeyi]KAA6453358.1 single-stranded DNA-binding protein [Bacillus swezeyi]TYS38731.1 single-stranded DNA-binding protein [Bacillus swezeyi]
MLNRVILTGRLTEDPVLQYTPNGTAVTSFSLAVKRNFPNQQGENDTDFFNCICWRKTAENVANFMKKGSLVGVDARLQSRNYQNEQGQRVFVVEVNAETVQFLENKNHQRGYNHNSKKRSGDSFDPYNSVGNSNHSENRSNPFREYDEQDDDLPF